MKLAKKILSYAACALLMATSSSVLVNPNCAKAMFRENSGTLTAGKSGTVATIFDGVFERVLRNMDGGIYKPDNRTDWLLSTVQVYHADISDRLNINFFFTFKPEHGIRETDVHWDFKEGSPEFNRIKGWLQQSCQGKDANQMENIIKQYFERLANNAFYSLLHIANSQMKGAPQFQIEYERQDWTNSLTFGWFGNSGEAVSVDRLNRSAIIEFLKYSRQIYLVFGDRGIELNHLDHFKKSMVCMLKPGEAKKDIEDLHRYIKN